jgi:hypothetical protein
MEVIWPADRDVTDVCLDYGLDPSSHQDLADKVETRGDGRKHFMLRHSSPRRDDLVTISWRWSSDWPVAKEDSAS